MRRNCVHIEAEDKPAGPGFSSRIPSARPPLREVQNADKRPLRYKKSSVDNLGTACAETQTSCLDSPLNKKHASKPEVITKSLKLRPIEDRFERNELSAASGKSAKSTDASTSKPRLGENKEVAGLSLTSKHCFIKSDANEKYCKYEFVVKYVHSDGDNLKPRKAVSPILPNPDVGKDVLLARFAEEPARKKTLLKARRLRTDQRDENSPYCIDIFNREYLAENMQESLRMDMYYTGRRGFLEKHNSHLTERDRSKILNWILTIAEDIKLSEYVYFKLVRLLDNILENLAIPKNMLQLVAIVACWILLKMDETWVPSVRKVGTLCANVYTTKQILDMEMKLLNFTAFNLKISAPNDFFYFQIVLQNDEKFTHCVNYILLLFTFDMRFSQFSSFELASAATYLAAHYLQIDIENTVPLKKLDSVREIVFLMDVQMNKMYTARALADHEFVVYQKYSDASHKKISTRLQELLKSKREVYKEKPFYYS